MNKKTRGFTQNQLRYIWLYYREYGEHGTFSCIMENMMHIFEYFKYFIDNTDYVHSSF